MRNISDFNSATEKYPVVYAGSATRPEYVDMPTTLQQQEGVAPIDTLPAQWWNAMWKLATKDINAFRDFVGNAFTEINNLLTKFSITLDDADSEQLYDFFHDTYVQSYLSTFFVNVTGDTIDGDLHIKGDLSVDGIGEEIISTELKVGANTITLRNDNPTTLGNTELAGVVTENYDGNNNNNIIAVNKNGEARTGDIDIATRILYSSNGINFFTDEELTNPATIGVGEEVRDTGNQTSGGVEIYEGITYSNDDTQPLLTRSEINALTDGHILIWDATNKRAIDGGSIEQAILSKAYPVGTIYQNKTNPTNPATLFGFGTWQKITDAFLACASANSYSDVEPKYNGSNTGGSTTATLSVTNLPYHVHSLSGFTQSADATFSIDPHRADLTVTHDHAHTFPIIVADRSGDILFARASHDNGADGNITTRTLSAENPDSIYCTVIDNGHIHTITQTAHSHELSGTTGGQGDGTAFSIIPQYQAVYTWYRSA